MDAMNPPPIDPTRCPLCGESNACGAQTGATSCWCFEVTIGPEVLARIPEEASGKACLCSRCARGEGATQPRGARHDEGPSR